MDYLAILDYKNLDNPLFLKSFAEAAAQRRGTKALFVHGDSEYTDRLIQTGMMREDAIIRSIQDLNHRLVSFFADYGLACIGINGFQRGTVKRTAEGDLHINTHYLNTLPDGTVIVLSNLIQGYGTPYEVLPLPVLAHAVQSRLAPRETHLFSVDAADEIILNRGSSAKKVLKWAEIEDSEILAKIPEEFHDGKININLSKPLHNSTLSSFEPIAKVTI